jgi:hypothetical protein
VRHDQQLRQGERLGPALAVLGAVLYYQWTAGVGDGTSGALGVRSSAGAAGRAQAQRLSPVPPVRLDALDAARAEPSPTAGRNLFQFQPKVAPLPPPTALRSGASVNGGGDNLPLAPPSPPPPPPIPFKFIGIVQAPDKKLAVLSDASTHDVFWGREGEVIDGRYRILRIGVESFEMAYVDGRGRQTIRLSGS